MAVELFLRGIPESCTAPAFRFFPDLGPTKKTAHSAGVLGDLRFEFFYVACASGLPLGSSDGAGTSRKPRRQVRPQQRSALAAFACRYWQPPRDFRRRHALGRRPPVAVQWRRCTQVELGDKEVRPEFIDLGSMHCTSTRWGWPDWAGLARRGLTGLAMARCIGNEEAPFCFFHSFLCCHRPSARRSCCPATPPRAPARIRIRFPLPPRHCRGSSRPHWSTVPPPARKRDDPAVFARLTKA